MLALLRRRRLGTATGSEATNGSVAKQWSTWTSIEAAQLNWMRNALSSSGLGLALIHFRREIDGAPPLGGLVPFFQALNETLDCEGAAGV